MHTCTQSRQQEYKGGREWARTAADPRHTALPPKLLQSIPRLSGRNEVCVRRLACIMDSAGATSWATHALEPTTRWLQFRDVPRLKSRRVAREMLLNAAMLPHVSPAITTSYKEHVSLVLCLMDRVRVWVSST